MPYAELHCVSNFTFLRGASHPEELVAQAHKLGYAALAITDECSLAGIVRAHVEAKKRALPLLVGSEFRLEDGMRFVLLATERESYGRLAALITTGRRNAAKGSYRLTRADLADGIKGCLALWLPARAPDPEQARWLATRFPGALWIAAERLLDADDARALPAADGHRRHRRLADRRGRRCAHACPRAPRVAGYADGNPAQDDSGTSRPCAVSQR